MASDSIQLKLRVIVVTTRAALRHTAGDAEQRSAVVERGRELLRGLSESADETARVEIERAYTELDEMERA